MRVPYVVGRWVRGVNHYGRQRSIEYLLSAEDNAFWIVGTRRIGKTSILRQLELITIDEAIQFEGRPYVPLFWDIQGCESAAQLSEELLYAIEDELARFEPYGISIDDLSGNDAIAMLRLLNRRLNQHGRRLLLLIDETEALIDIAEREGNWLARLRKAFQQGDQRTIVTATKLLSRLNNVDDSWSTSPFLFGFRLVNLWSLDESAAIGLVHQVQTDAKIAVDDGTLRDILLLTNRHPYLTQYLCQRLFISENDETGTLRPIVREDLIPDQLLAGFFRIDFQHLSDLERRLLLSIAELSVAAEQVLCERHPDQPASRVRQFLYGMGKLGLIRQIGGHWTVGNEFLRHWLQEHMQTLVQETAPAISDAGMEALVQSGAGDESAFLRREIADLEHALGELMQRQTQADDTQMPELLAQEITTMQRRIVDARQSIADIRARFHGGQL